jgi:hypothetical protein
MVRVFPRQLALLLAKSATVVKGLSTTTHEQLPRLPFVSTLPSLRLVPLISNGQSLATESVDDGTRCVRSACNPSST